MADDLDIDRRANRTFYGIAAVTEDFWSTDPEYNEWLDSLEEQDDEYTNPDC